MTDAPRRRGAERTDAIMLTTLELGREIGYARLSIEAVAARAGVGKHTIYRRWSSKGALLLDSLLSLNESGLDYPDTGDIAADLRAQIYAAVDLLGGPPFGPLFQALVGEAQHDRQVAVTLNERFIAPQADKTVARLKAARDQGQVAPDFDLELAMAILSGPLYFQLLITQEPLTHEYVDRVLDALFAGLRPS
ncbi:MULTISPECIES: TetR/AcrR family transcriptional regulator [Micromonospora]|jgi:AcrR family transcriptional regulator|uniref:TetR family transcriptional regulator n=1 Tax=Micromonospora sicca TaxID=2202420 RepID=A0A317DJN2_9ACTN|nr:MULTISPECIES: TetR/AcrR family transcriptional regulator [unclassified Micromonospora]MBM0224235.1 TetR/AcrR family transcriptional regulator [Micromonospora sp. ATA51]MDZ5447721.1 TetR/AcrR family transcriptional regulator [Micromonospora sp. 4G57]MDZ5494432.1 TetR/AcrR family transcriptional regulator [Micromonospora sp. 4G53]PWR13125.1 TetR family transcriptional regulator [Micromonospora sp. 4G51]